MAPDPASSKSKGSRYRSSNDTQHSMKTGKSLERGSQRAEAVKGKSDKEGWGLESERRVKRRQNGGGGADAGQGTSLSSASGGHRSSKRWRGGALDATEIPITIDRWDGGTSDTPKELAFSTGKSKHESDGRSGECIIVKASNAQLVKDGGEMDKTSRKHKVFSKSSLVADNRAITVMDLQETNTSLIDTNIRIKNKVSYRRDARSDMAEAELQQSLDENTKITFEATRSRRRWDGDERKGAVEDLEHVNLPSNAGREGSVERDRRKEKSSGGDVDRDAEVRMQDGLRSEGSLELALDVDYRLEVSDGLEHGNEFKIQEELRNIELEKELENRIRRRREESGDRDRWRDDDREREGKRHADSRDERTRDEKHRSKRDKERQNDRYESRQHREGSKSSDGRQRDDRYYEIDREHRSHRDEGCHSARSKGFDEHNRADRGRDPEHRPRRSRANASVHDAERRSRDRGHQDEPPEREMSYPTSTYVESSDGIKNVHRHKRARESDGHGPDKEHYSQTRHAGESDVVMGSDVVRSDQTRRSKEEQDKDGRLENPTGSPRDDIVRGKSKSNWRNDSSASELWGEGLPSPQHDARASPSSNCLDYDDQRSPRYFSQWSPSSRVDISCAPVRGKTGQGDWLEASNSVSTSSGPPRRPPGSGLLTSDRGDRLKCYNGAEEEVKSGLHRSNWSLKDGRDSSLSPHRFRDHHLSGAPTKPQLHGQDSLPRHVGSGGSMECRVDRGGWRAPLQGGGPGFDGCPMDFHGLDDSSPQDKSDRVRRIPMNRSSGSPMVRSQGPQLSSMPVPPLAPLPPPPPFRPGIDNPAVLGPLNGGFDDTGGSREQGRGERKGVLHRRGDSGGSMGPGEVWRAVNIGNWNSRNQGLLPGTGFPPFPPQFGPHLPAGVGNFPGMIQQFPGPPMFPGVGVRPPLEMGFGAGRFLGPGSHMGDGGDRYLGPGLGSVWHGPGEVDDGRGPPLLGPGDGWDGPVPHGDDCHRRVHLEWERSGPVGVCGWMRDRERDIWEGQGREGGPDFIPQHSQVDPLPLNPAFQSAGSGGGLSCDTEVSNDVKSGQERTAFDKPDAKRKPDRVSSKLNAGKPSGQAVPASEGRLTKCATATMQSILSQLDISRDLAGPELYAQYCALLPPLDSGQLRNTFSEEGNTDSESADEDLILEADLQAEALIASPGLVAVLLPPLQERVFEEALRLYRKPETENRVQKSLRGSFVLPFDPSTIKVPSISFSCHRNLPKSFQCQPAIRFGGLLDQLDADVEDAVIEVDMTQSTEQEVKTFEHRQEILGSPHEFVGANLEVRKEAGMQDQFLSLHVEVAEYSDREFEAEIDDAIEEVSLKGQIVGEFSGMVEPAEESKHLVEDVAQYRGSTDRDTLIETSQSVPDFVDNMHHQISQTGVEIDTETNRGGNVNSFVILTSVMKFDHASDAEKKDVIEEVKQIVGPEKIGLEANCTFTDLVESENACFTTPVEEEFSLELVEEAGDFFVENLENESVLEEVSQEREGFTSIESVDEVKVPEEINRQTFSSIETMDELKVPEEIHTTKPMEMELGVAQPTEVGICQLVDVECNGVNLGQDSSTLAVGVIGNLVSEEVASTALESDLSLESTGKLKEIVEIPSVTVIQELVPVTAPKPEPEPLPRTHKRRASSRLLAQAMEAQAGGLQEDTDALVGEVSVGVKEVGTKGTRSSQRRSKRRGSTH